MFKIVITLQLPNLTGLLALDMRRWLGLEDGVKLEAATAWSLPELGQSAEAKVSEEFARSYFKSDSSIVVEAKVMDWSFLMKGDLEPKGLGRQHGFADLHPDRIVEIWLLARGEQP